jgi:DNA repair protein RecN (Recombination protein N)
MLKQLTIANIVLIESLTLDFDSGLNVLTGETGAGKSSIISALRLILGERSDFSQIRRNAEKASVCALFEVKDNKDLLKHLFDSGIDHDQEEPLILKRELSSQLKSRSFVNNQPVQLSQLEAIGRFLISHVHQHAYVELFSQNAHLQALDAFSLINLKDYQEAFLLLENKKEYLKTLLSVEASKNAEKERLQEEIKEIQHLNLQESEDEELFKNYSLMINQKEASSKLSKISSFLFEGKTPIIPLISKSCQEVQMLNQRIEGLDNVDQLLSNVVVELKEVHESLSRIESQLEINEHEFEAIECRLSQIDLIKKKYGSNVQDILKHLQNSLDRIKKIEDDELKIIELHEMIPLLEQEVNQLASDISKLRCKQALILEDIITNEIKTLNMPNAIFKVLVVQGAKTNVGIDKVEFLFAPNQGEKILSLKDCASGGEMSRVLLALKTSLAHVEKVSTLILDEIDAHLGGITATLVGEKIKNIGQQRQVICITHLPQVAKIAKQHFQIVKIEKEGRTFTLANLLDEKSKRAEMNRMLGVIA